VTSYAGVQVDEDGQSSDDESITISPSVLDQKERSQRRPSVGNERHDDVLSATPPTSVTVLDRTGADPRSNGSEIGRGVEEQKVAVPGGRAAEGGANAVVVRKRVAGLWSKLRAIAYIASLQVGV